MEQWLYQILPDVPLLLLFVIILGTLFLLSKGADILVDEAVTLSIRWGIPKVLIGATIVSLGTTLPEASVSVAAAIGGNPDIALGNAIGSVICNTGLIIGIASLIRPLPIHRSTTDQQSWILMGAGFLLVIVTLPWSHLGGLFSVEGNIPQWVGFIFLILLISYLYLSLRQVKSKTSDVVPIEGEQDHASISVVIIKLIIGMTLIIVSSKVLLPTVVTTADRVGIPQSIIAATLIAFGTSLPELVTAIQASRKGHGELAVGNIIGANILNIFFVVGAATAVTEQGLTVPSYFYWFHIPFMLIILILFKIFLTAGKPVISKIQGIVLLIVYVIYSALGYILI